MVYIFVLRGSNSISELLKKVDLLESSLFMIIHNVPIVIFFSKLDKVTKYFNLTMQSTSHGRNSEDQGNEHLLDYRHHLALSQKMANIGSWGLDLSVDYPEARQYRSDETFRILSYEPGQIVPSFNAFINSVHPEDREVVLEAAQVSIKEGRAYDLEQRHAFPNGQIIVTRSIAEGIGYENTSVPLKQCGAMKLINAEKLKNLCGMT